MNYPDSSKTYPLDGVERICYLKNIIKNPQIIVGDFTYYDDPESVFNFEKNVLYLFDFVGDRLIVGKFCQIASGVKFIMNGANHPMHGISTYPFKVFGAAWSSASLAPVNKGDTVIGNDVWIGNGVTFMPGVRVGDGSIIASGSVVTRDVDPYTIVGGNPAKEIRKRFDESTVRFLIDLQWWNMPLEMITDCLESLTEGDIESLKRKTTKV